MTIKKVLIENPEITEELRDFFKSKLLSTMVDNDKIPQSFKDAIEANGVSETMLETYLTATPRLICDFMDEKEIIILVSYNQDEFSYTINGKPHSASFYHRIDAETSSVIKSIEHYKNMFNQIDEEK